MWTRRELKDKGSWCFKANYWKCVLVGLLVLLIGGGTGAASGTYSTGDADIFTGEMGREFGGPFFSGYGIAFIFGAGIIAVIIALVLVICLINPLSVGTQAFFVKNLNTKADISEVARGFDRNYKNVVSVMFKYDLYLFLWSLLFIIPGIYKSYEYRMIPYLLAENPDMPEQEAFQRSRDMMDGQKWKAFVLDLSFIGWHILGALTLGILEIFYVYPYQLMTNAALYERLMYGTPAGGYNNGDNGYGYGNGGYNGNDYGGYGYGNGGYNGNGYGGYGYGNGGYNGNGYGGYGYGNGGYNGNGYGNGGYNGYGNGGYNGSGYGSGGYNGGYDNSGYNGSGYGNGGYNGNGCGDGSYNGSDNDGSSNNNEQ